MTTCNVLLPEIWDNILSHLIGCALDLKRTSLVSRIFQELSRVHIWHCPIFYKRHLSSNDLTDIANFQPPIRTLNLLQLELCVRCKNNPDAVTMKELETLNHLLTSQFNLTEFTAGEGCSVSAALATMLLKWLPVTSFHTNALDKKEGRIPISYLRQYSLPVINIILDCLVEKQHQNFQRCLEVRIGGLFHRQMAIEHWRLVASLHIVEINAWFQFTQLEHFQEYVAIVQQLRPQLLRYSILRGKLTPQQLRAFTNIPIVELHMQALDLADHSIQEYVCALRALNQRPALAVFDLKARTISVDEFKLLLAYPIRILDCNFVSINEQNIEEFTQLVIDKHAAEPIERFFIPEHMGRYSEPWQLERFVEVGLVERVQMPYELS